MGGPRANGRKRLRAGALSGWAVLGLMVLAGCWLWRTARPRAHFVIRIESGAARAVSGRVARPFVREVGEVCRRHGTRRGEVRGVIVGDRIALEFSRGLSGPCRQQLRNLWNVSGWPPPGRSRPL